MGLLDSVKKMANDKFLQVVVCSCCQNELKIRNTEKLSDGNYICKRCMRRIPKEFCRPDTMENVEKIINYMTYSKTELKPIFEYTYETSYGPFEIDPVHGLFRFGYESELIFKLSDIISFDMQYVPEEYKEKALSVKKCNVYGRVMLELLAGSTDTEVPLVVYNETVDNWAKSVAVKERITDSLYTVELPFKLRTFLENIAPYIDTEETADA